MNAPSLNLSNGAVAVKSLSLGEGANPCTLSVIYGDMDTKLLTVTEDVDIGANGILTHGLNSTSETHR